ncbi:MAG: hypothetical protein ABSH28_21225 [Acidobacteriota bacterium]|jgi:hypothetical protein
MIDVAEHVYHDDPRIGHPDVRTQLRDVCYYFIGNGLIEGAIQFAPAGEGSPYGLLLMDPQQLKMKRESLSFDPNTGIETTMLFICREGTEPPLVRNLLNACWDRRFGFPCVRVEWQTNGLAVSEMFYCPDRSSGFIVREIQLRNCSSSPSNYSIRTGIRSQSIARDIYLPARGEAALFINYSMDEIGRTIDFAWEAQRPWTCESSLYWSGATKVSFDSATLDHLFETAAWQLPAMISRTGRIDAGIWQYTREWVRDQSFMAHAALLSGHPLIAKVMLERLLREFISEEGSTVDSSEVRAYADSELDQNGTLLHVLHEYVLWTGDIGILRSNWDRIVRIAEFPLKAVFRESNSGLMFNQRDYWERHGIYGIEPGIELMYQVFVSVGLSAAAGLARQIGESGEAAHWKSEAARLKEAILHHPTHALVSKKGFFKRRGIDGCIQEFIRPKPNHGLPNGVGLARDIPHPLNPDSASALPIVLGFVSPESAVTRATLDQLETLWNQGWETGGYGRYHMDSDPDSPGPWPFASLYIARAYMECREYEKVWRVIHWLASLPQYPSGAFFEMYGNRIAPPYAQNGIVPWNWAEVIMLVVKNILGFQPEEGALRMRPRLLPGLKCAEGEMPFRGGRIYFAFSQEDGIDRPRFQVNSNPIEAEGDCVLIPLSSGDTRVEGIIPGDH